jgi:hypothetical protein
MQRFSGFFYCRHGDVIPTDLRMLTSISLYKSYLHRKKDVPELLSLAKVRSLLSNDDKRSLKPTQLYLSVVMLCFSTFLIMECIFLSHLTLSLNS